MHEMATTELLRWMTASGAPFEQVFFDWFCGSASAARAKNSRIAELYEKEEFAPVRAALTAATPSDPERLNAAYFSRRAPCTMLIDEVETIWAAIADNDDWSLLDAKLAAIAEMREAYGFEASRYSDGAPTQP